MRSSVTALAAALIAAGALLAVPAAVAKDFGPGDLRVCGRADCVPIVNRSLLRVLSSYYGFFCGRFVRGNWYRFPAPASHALRRLTLGLRPLQVSPPPLSC
ncbi:MAG TPA: hypothetical protein VE753_10600 [Gaiellaceae bacterium]|jgi:hypothetical protein|nr:hypothetical protein [Gaiellaceae bacterium]